MDVPEESDALQAARVQRRGVRAALGALESAAASPALDATWTTVLSERLQALREAFAHHVEVTEGDDGLFEETLERAPRLARRTKVLRDDHVTIASAIDDALDVVAATAHPVDDDRISAIRASVTDVMGRIARHRQLGADLVHEAYNVDIEGGD